MGTPAEVLTTTMPNAITAEVTLPALFRIDWTANTNTIRQVTVPSWRGTATVQDFSQSRMRGYTVTPSDGSSPVLLLTNGAQGSAEWTHVVRMRNAQLDFVNAVSVDLSEANWIRHPEAEPQFTTQAEYETQAANALASWSDAFRYKREDTAQNIEGLRPPQIGAIYAIQSHWTINVDPATVVLPTGVGKTETMLSVLVAERCQRLLVVVPTDALRTQIA